MPITKTYEDSFTVSCDANTAWRLAVQAVQAAGFKKIKHSNEPLRVTGDWKPFIGTLWGDIEVEVQAEHGGSGSVIRLRSKAGVDNVGTLTGSPGKRIFQKFADAFNPLVAVATPGSGIEATAEDTARTAGLPPMAAPVPPVSSSSPASDIAELLGQLKALYDSGVLTEEEYVTKKTELLGRM